MANNQGRSVGVWRQGQEVKLAPLVLIFSKKIFKMVDPKQISVICKSVKQKKKKKIPKVCSHMV